MDCISAPNDGLNPSVILTVEGAPLTAQYVFNVPDAVSRFCLEHKLRPGLGLRGVFVTGTGHELLGLPGLVMRLRGDGHGAFELFGAGEVGEYVRLMTNVCSWKAPAVLVHGFGRGGEGDTTCLYEDEHVRVWALWDGGEAEGERAGEDDGGDVGGFAGPSGLDRADVLEQLRSLAPARGAQKHSVFGRRYVKCADVEYGDVWMREGRDERKYVAPGRTLLGYACYVKGADEVVVVSGYVEDVGARFGVLRRHWLVRGCVDRQGSRVAVTMVLAGGGSVPRDVLDAERDSVRVIALPTVGNVESNDGTLGFDSTAETAARLHLLCPHAFPAPYAWKYLREAGDDMQRSEDTEGAEGAEGKQPRSGAFRMTIGAATHGAVYVPYASDSTITSIEELRMRCGKAAEFLEALEDDEREALDELRDTIRASASSRRMLDGARGGGERDRKGDMDGVPANNRSAAADLRQRLLGNGRIEGKRKRAQAGAVDPKEAGEEAGEENTGGEANAADGATTASDLVAPYVLFLGTGSAEPSKYRGPSGILVKIPFMADDYLLLECGEGTFGQLVRMFGHAGAMERLAKLRCVWISHRHADHMSGLVELLCWRATCAPSSLKEPELMVLGPQACVRWLRSLRHVDGLRMGRFRVEPLWTAHKSHASRQMQRRIRARMTCTPVQHCTDAFAVSFVFGIGANDGSDDGGTGVHDGFDDLGSLRAPETFKLVYSGDTEPCEALVRDGQGADMFIHEATFENDMVRWVLTSTDVRPRFERTEYLTLLHSRSAFFRQGRPVEEALDGARGGVAGAARRRQARGSYPLQSAVPQVPQD